MAKKNYYLTIDTETTNTIEQPIVYDIGGIVHDKQGNVQETFSFVVADVFLDMYDVMQVAYYSDKIPQYWEKIKSGETVLKTWYNIRKHICSLFEKYNIKAVIAYNANFDYRATRTTQKYLTKSKYKRFFPKGTEIWDSMAMAKSTIAKQKLYSQFCSENEYLTKRGQNRATAEIMYRYISGNNDFVERHTALADCEIEVEIFKHCLRQHKAMKTSPRANGKLIV
jgi:DNA polymerase III epsilon subunit-like protein